MGKIPILSRAIMGYGGMISRRLIDVIGESLMMASRKAVSENRDYMLRLTPSILMYFTWDDISGVENS